MKWLTLIAALIALLGGSCTKKGPSQEDSPKKSATTKDARDSSAVKSVATIALRVLGMKKTISGAT